jgi:hypothetical protein
MVPSILMARIPLVSVRWVAFGLLPQRRLNPVGILVSKDTDILFY